MGNTVSDFGFRVIGLRVSGFGSEPCGGGFRVQSLAQEARFAPQLGKRWKLEVWEAWFRVMALPHKIAGQTSPSIHPPIGNSYAPTDFLPKGPTEC